MTDLRTCLQAAVPEDLLSDEECVTAEVFKVHHSKLQMAIDAVSHSEKETFNSFLEDSSNKVLITQICGFCFGNAHNKNFDLSRSAERFLTERFLPSFAVGDMQEFVKLHTDVVRRVLTLLKSHLQKEKWKHFPFHRDAFVWLLRRLSYPELNDCLDLLLPFSLIVIDDYRTDMKILGMQCLRHIIRHSLKAHMRYTGRSDLLYDSLKRLIYTRDSHVLDEAYACLLELLATFRDFRRPTPDSRPCVRDPYDELCEKLLFDLSIENHASLKSVFLKHLNTFIDSMGNAFLKHTKTFLNCIENCLVQTSGIKVQRQMLRTVIKFVHLSRPIFKDVVAKIVQSLIGVLLFSDNSKELLPDVCEVFLSFPADHRCLEDTLLSAVNEEFDNEDVRELMQMMKSSNINMK